jgi:hypothetical protein
MWQNPHEITSRRLPTPEPAELASGVQFGQVAAEEAQTGALGSRKPAVSPGVVLRVIEFVSRG